MVDTAYIRPCGVFPDGLKFLTAAVPELKRRKLIGEEPDYPGDYGVQGTREPEKDDRRASRIMQIVERVHQQFGFPVGSVVRGRNRHTAEAVVGTVTALAIRALGGKPYNTVAQSKWDGEVDIEPHLLRYV